MESRVNYTYIGIFVVIFSIGLITFAFWLGKYGQDENDYRRFHVYLTESVSGLSPDAAVKYNGVDVGKVESIRINPHNSEEVELTLKIKKETPIKADSYAMLKFYGITGLAFIEIAGGSKNAPLIAQNGREFATIRAKPSLITRLDESLSNVATRLSETLEHVDRLFTDENVENVSQTLKNLRSLSTQLEGYQDEVRVLLEKGQNLESNASETMATMQEAAQNVSKTSQNVDKLMKTKVTTLLASLEETSNESRVLIQKLEASLDRGDYDLRSIASPTVSELNDVLARTQTLSNEVEMTLRQLRQSPSDLLFKKSTPKPGPGE